MYSRLDLLIACAPLGYPDTWGRILWWHLYRPKTEEDPKRPDPRHFDRNLRAKVDRLKAGLCPVPPGVFGHAENFQESPESKAWKAKRGNNYIRQTNGRL